MRISIPLCVDKVNIKRYKHEQIKLILFAYQIL